MNPKAKGTRAEHKTIRWLEALGYRCTRAAGSLGEWDIIAIGPRDVRLVQVKCNRFVYGVEKEKLELFRAPENVSKEVWRWDDYAREPKVVVM